MVTFRPGEIIKLRKACKSLAYSRFKIETPALVAKSDSITKTINLIDGLGSVKKGDNVLIKPNINSDDEYPGTTRVAGLVELIRLLKVKKARIAVGDMSSAFWSHTRECSERVGIKQACEREGVPLLFFEESKWMKMILPNTSLKHCYLPEDLCNYEHVINLCVLKTHRLSDFTLSLKNLMGLLHMRTRMRMHASNLKQQIGEFNKVLNPVINIVDGIKCFIDGGPDKGELRESGVVLASKDRVALDASCVNIIKKLGSKSLKDVNPWCHPQIKTAVKHGLGVKSEKGVRVVE